MLKRLTVTNFQSHENSELELAPGVNVIVGTNDSGKSALFRALRWLTTNLPSGSAFRSFWGGETSVLAEFDDGSVERVRSNKKGNRANAYVLHTGSGKYQLDAPGASVPESVVRFLKLDSLNWQRQHDAPYLLSDAYNAGEVARLLNEVVALGKIDTSVSNVNARARENARELKAAREDVKRLQTELSDFADLKDRDKALRTLEDLRDALDVQTDDAAELDALVKTLERRREESARHARVLKANPALKRLLALRSGIATLKDQADSLDALLAGIEEKRDEASHWQHVERDALSSFAKLMPSTCPVCKQRVGKEAKRHAQNCLIKNDST